MTEIIQRAFASGEITPSLYARVDHVKYTTGLRTCRNYVIKRHGGVESRPGTKWVGFTRNAASSAFNVKLVPWIFNDSQTYILEFGNLYIRFIFNGSYVTDTSTSISAITKANPGVITATGHGLSTGNSVYVSGVSGMTELNNRTFDVTVIDANNFSIQDNSGININTTGYGTYVSGGTIRRIYTLSSSFSNSFINDLRFSQSADVMNITHPSFVPIELRRLAHTNWTMTNKSFGPSIGTPTNVTASLGGGNYNYYVTAVTEFGEESLPGISSGAPTPTTGAPVTVTWTAVSGANSYNIYRNQVNGTDLPGTGLIGSVSKFEKFTDDGIDVDFNKSWPTDDNPFSSVGDRPTCSTYYQGRFALANTNNNPESVWMSHSGSFDNFSILFPSIDSGRVVFTLAGRQVNSVEHMTDIGRLICFTSSGEWAIQGNDAGIITPTEINPLQYSYNGIGNIAPIVANGSALYVQSRGTVVRDLLFNSDIAGYSGNDLSLFSSHLFDNYSLVDWDYQKIPDSVIWMARNDGSLLSLTYVREQNIFGWARHDFSDGDVVSVASIPSGTKDDVYFIVRRQDGNTIRDSVEYLSTRRISDIADFIGMDSSLSYDGYNTGITTMMMANGSNWTYDETIDCFSMGSLFTADDVGKQVHFNPGTEDEIRFTIETYLAANRVQGKPHKTVPANLRNDGTLDWAIAVKNLSGLWHLEGKDVSIMGDGFVISSPNNPAYNTITVSNGSVTLDKHHAKIHVGLPFTSDIQTLDIETATGETMVDKRKNITRVAIYTENTRGLWAGESPPSDDSVDPLENLFEFRPRYNESQELPASLKTEPDFINIKGRWNIGGRVFLRQIDPIPSSILAISPSGYIPFRGG